MFSKDKNTGIRLYKEFVLKKSSEDITRVLGRIRVPPVLGDERFMKWVKGAFFNKKYDKEVPQSKLLAPSVQEIRSAVSKFYGIDEKELLGYKRGVANEPLKIAIYLARRLSRDSLDEIAKAFNVGAYSSVSSVVSRTGSQLQTDSRLKKSHLQIYSSLTMRQAKTPI
jgi:putative transposase